jgi:ABC-type transporter Mla subunit MlaD
MHIALIIEGALTVLLAATLVYCAILERRLAALRRGQDGFQKTIGELNAAIESAGNAIRTLKTSTAGASGALDERLVKARGLIDELSLVTASADRIAQRIERGTVSSGERTNAANGSSVLANRLDALRPQNLRADGTRAASMGQIR